MIETSEVLACERDDFTPMDPWELLTEIVMSLVSRPDVVKIDESVTPEGVLAFRIHVAPEDRGKVIGRNGETVSILTKLLARMATLHGTRIHVEVDDPARYLMNHVSAVRRNDAA